MKYLMFLLLFSLSFVSFADQRIDADSSNCHAAIDPNDDDNEIDLPGCNFNSQINRYINEAGIRVASGSYSGILRIKLRSGVLPKGVVPNHHNNIYLRGVDADPNWLLPGVDYIEATNTQCALVRSNYQANNNGDDQNQTEYTGNNWMLSVEYMGGEETMETGSHYGLWEVRFSCIGATQ